MPDAVVPTVVPVLTVGADESVTPPDHQFQVATDVDFVNVICASGWLVSTATFTVPASCGLKADGSSYFWRPQAHDDFLPSPWSDGQRFTVGSLRLGSREYWPMWSHGPLEVNLSNGNLVLSMPGPSYATAVGTMGAALSYNSLDTASRGLGVGWTLVAGDELASPPVLLVDHQVLAVRRS